MKCSRFLLAVLSLCGSAMADSVVVFNEIHYHPATSEPEKEFIELHNQMSVDVDLSGWAITGGVNYTFPANTILPGRGYLVVAANPAGMQTQLGFATAMGPFTGRLSNSGEELRLRDNNDRLMDEVIYGTDGKWPVGADGAGPALAKSNPNAASAAAENWTNSWQQNGTPGAENFPDPAAPFIAPYGLVAWWRMDELSGATTADSVGNHVGSLGAGVSRVGGLTGAGALEFNNTASASVNVGTHASLNVTTGLSIEAILKSTWNGVGTDVIYSRNNSLIPAGITAWYAFDEANSGTVAAVDAIGGTNGTFLNTATRVAGRSGNVGAMRCNNAAGDGVSIGTAHAFTTGLTIAAWIKPTWSGNSGDYDQIFRKEDGGNRILFCFQNDVNNGGASPPVAAGPVLSFGLNTSGYKELDMPLDGASGRPTLAQLKDGNWHHVAATYDSVTGTKGIWIDGTLRFSTTHAGNILSGGGVTGFIGNTSGGGEPFSGDIDDFALYNVVLTPAQMVSLASDATTPLTTLPVPANPSKVLLALQNDGENGAANPPVSAGPVLAFGLNLGGVYSELDMPLDGASGRPTVAELTNGQEHHVVATYDSATGVKALYVNGTLRYSTTLSGVIASTGSAPGTIGNLAPAGSQPFTGTIDEVAYWNVPLTADIISQHAAKVQLGENYFAPRYPNVPPPTVRINEIGAAQNFFIELQNTGSQPVDLTGFVIRVTGTGGGTFVLPAQSLAAEAWASFSAAQLGMSPAVGAKVFFSTASNAMHVDSLEVDVTGRARTSSGGWAVPSAATQGVANTFAFQESVVISEIMYRPRPQAGTAAVMQDSTLIPLTANWRYVDSGVEPATAWKTVGYADQAWSVGAGMFSSATGSGNYAAAVAADAPVAYWKLDDATTIISDASGFGRNGTATAGVTLGASPLVYDGAASRAIALSGTNRITVPGFEKIGSTGYSVEYWVQVVTPPTGFVNLVGDGESGGDFFFMNYLSPSLQVRPHYGFGNSPVSLDTISSLNQTQTYHVVTTWDAVNPTNNGVIYINGVPDKTGTISRNLPSAGTTGNNMIFIGYDNREPASGSFLLDEIAFYDHPLSAARVAAHYAMGAAPGPRQTVLATGPQVHYFRREFQFTGNPAATELSLRLAADDGAVVYLNGREVHRSNLPLITLTAASSALQDRTASLSGPIELSSVPLVNGTNVLAVAVYQTVGGSNDVFMGLELNARETLVPAAPATEDPNTWLELHNRSVASVDLTGWRMDDGVDFAFAPGTTIPAGGRLVVAKDPALFSVAHPAVTAVGPLLNKFSRSGERIVLRDALGNVADTVTYADRGRWPSSPDGGGSSLELKDSRADNDVAEAWAASDESARSSWQTVTYRAVAAADGGPVNFNEFVLGLLDEGEVLLDDIHVISEPGTGNATELVVPGDFESGGSAWRMRGNHAQSAVVAELGNPGNHVLHVKSSGGTDVINNCVETTLVGNTAVVNGREYEISFRAKWIAGTNLLNTRFYWNRCAKVTRLQVPAHGGTPGAANTVQVANLGPTYRSLRHDPAVPAVGEACTVSVAISDPDNIASAQLFYAVNGGSWQSTSLTATGDVWSGTIPGQSAAAVVQFYVQATDSIGAVSAFPQAGSGARALIPWQDGLAQLSGAHQFRLLMTAADRTFMLDPANLTSDATLGGTVIYDEQEIFYNVSVRLKGSEHGRSDNGRQSYNISFSPEKKFRGVHNSVLLDRSGGWRFGTTFGQDEMLVKHIITQAGGVASLRDDMVRFIAPHGPHTGPALLQMARYGQDYLDSLYQDGGDGNLYKLEIAYHTTATDNGLPTGNKLAQEGGISILDLGDLGPDAEAYRWFYRKENRTDNDDFTPAMNVVRAFGKSGAAFDEEIDPLIDNDQWMRCLALEVLCGISDIFSRDNGHNLNLYQRPKDGKILALPWDWDFAFIQATNAPLWSGRQVSKLIQRPHNLRCFYAHLQDIMAGPFNAAYMGRWADHYDNFAPGQDYSSITAWIGARAAFVQSQIPADAVWAVTTAPANEALVAAGAVQFAGTAPFGYKKVEFQNAGCEPVEVTFTSAGNWIAEVPIMLGRNVISVRAYDGDNLLIGSVSQNFVVIGTEVGVFADADFDGLPDGWECLVGLDLLPAAHADADSDGDGQTDLQEYLSGTNPLDAGESMVIDPPTTDVAERRFLLPVKAGRSYRFQASETLGAGSWSTLHTVAPGNADAVVEYVEPLNAIPRKFYRMVTP